MSIPFFTRSCRQNFLFSHEENFFVEGRRIFANAPEGPTTDEVAKNKAITAEKTEQGEMREIKELQNELKALQGKNSKLESTDKQHGLEMENKQKELFKNLGNVMNRLNDITDTEEREKLLTEVQKLLADPSIKSEILAMYTKKNTPIAKILKGNNREMVLATMAVPRDENGMLWYDVNLPTETAEDRIGLGNILPKSERFVMVHTADGKEIVGYRDYRIMFKGIKRDGFVNAETGQYIPILNGDSFRAINESEYKIAAQNKQYSQYNFSLSEEDKKQIKEETGKDVQSFDDAIDSSNESYASYLEKVEDLEDATKEVFGGKNSAKTMNLEKMKGFTEVLTTLGIEVEKGKEYSFEERIALQEQIAEKVTNLSGTEYESILAKMGRNNFNAFIQASGLNVGKRFGSGEKVFSAINEFLDDHEDDEKVAPLIALYGGKEEFAKWLLGLSAIESGYNFNAFTFSGTDCSGIFQFSGGTAAMYHLNPFSIPQSVEATVKLMKGNWDGLNPKPKDEETLRQAILLSHNHGGIKVNKALSDGNLSSIIGVHGNKNGIGFYNLVKTEHDNWEKYSTQKELTPEEVQQRIMKTSAKKDIIERTVDNASVYDAVESVRAEAKNLFNSAPKEGKQEPALYGLTRIDQVIDFRSGTPTPFVNSAIAEDFFTFALAYQKLTGEKLIVTSAFRGIKRQQELVDQNRRAGTLYRNGKKMVADPGNSMHNLGLATDLNEHCYTNQKLGGKFTELAKVAGFAPLSYEAWHIENIQQKRVVAGNRYETASAIAANTGHN